MSASVFLTGVGGYLTAKHTDPHMNEGTHEHTWHVIAWYPAEPWRDARSMKAALKQGPPRWSPRELPADLFSGEAA